MSTMIEYPRSEGENAFALAIRKARAITSSTLVPENYRGENNLANAMIALEVAERIGAAPLLVMQNLYVVHGRPGWSSTFLIATVNGCGRFTPLRFEVQGTDPEKDDYRVRAVARDRESDEVLNGTWITWKMVKAEGWEKKTGSKWKTMPEQMFMYRAAAFWTRMYAPELSLGIHTADEVNDTYGSTQAPQRADLDAFQERLEARAIPAEQKNESELEFAADGQDEMPTQEIHDTIAAAETLDALDEAADLIRSAPEDDRIALRSFYETRRDALELDGL